MLQLEISLLGTVSVRREGTSVTGRAYAKVLGLLAWLAVESGRPHQRAYLASLLWPEHDDERARHSLRQALSTLRRVLGPEAGTALEVTRDTITFHRTDAVRIDVHEVLDRVAACERHEHLRIDRCAICARRLEAAAALVGGEFLQGFSIGESTAFEDWVQVWRERLRQQARSIHETLAAWHMERGAVEEAIAAVRELLALDPLEEAAHQQLMTLLLQAGRRAEALAQYERLVDTLDEELGVEPDPETEALHERLLAPEGAPAGEGPRMARSATAQALPVPSTALLGRERELEEIAELLAHRDCRLLTLLGPGGSGKTRLAIEIATRQSVQAPGAVAFVSLVDLTDPRQLVPAIAEALGVNLLGSGSPDRQLSEWLRERGVFLVLDNTEHLAGDLRVVAHLLGAAPGLRVLATSRERLRLQGEWVFDVGGLAVPHGDPTDSFEGYGAVELFRERLRQARARQPLRHEERPAVARICQLVEGMPLALELAAAWGQALPLEQIADEIQRNLDFLATSMLDVPDRHRSMRAVFNHSWVQLDEDDRRTFLRLSVFRDGFDLAAAEAVAETSALQLARLVEKSLLTQQEGGRYRLHELLRQYADERLREERAVHADLQECHGSYYLEWLAGREDALTGRDQHTALAEIERDIENIRAAWRWAVDTDELALVGAASHALWLYYVIRGRMREAAAAFGMVLEAVEGDGRPIEERPWPDRLAWARAMTRCGGFRSGLGRYEEARDLLERGIEALREMGQRREVGLALNMLAAAQHLKGDLASSRALLEESLAEYRAIRDAWGVAFSLNDLGLVSYLLEENVDAERFCRESLAMFREIGDRRGQAFAAFNLGMIAEQRGDHDTARRFYEESLSLRESRHDRWGIAASMVHLAAVLHRAGDADRARDMLVEALGIAWDSSVTPVVLDALVELSALDLEAGETQRAADLLTAIVEHPATPAPTRERVAAMLATETEPLVHLDDPATWAVRTVDDVARQLVS